MVKTTVFLLGESAADRQRAFSTALGGRTMMPILSISSIMCHCEEGEARRGNPLQISCHCEAPTGPWQSPSSFRVIARSVSDVAISR